MMRKRLSGLGGGETVEKERRYLGPLK